MPEEEIPEGFEDFPDYVLSSPQLLRYSGMIHQLLDVMNDEAEASPVYDLHFEIFRDCLMTLYRRVVMDGDIHGIDNLLKLHYPEYYPHCELIGTAELATKTLSTDN